MSNFVSITDNEDKGVKDILGFFGGECRYSIGVSASSSEGNGKFFELELSKCEAIEQWKDDPQIPSSNMAYRFFSQLKEERKNYNEIRSVLIFKDGKKTEAKYSVKELQLVSNRMNVVKKIVNLIKEKKFDAIKPMLNDSSVFHYNKNTLIKNIENADPEFGNITEEGYRFWGYRINTTNTGMQLLHISLVLIRDKQSSTFSVDLDLNGTNNEVYLLNYKL